MRIVIDLQACQSGPEHARAEALSAALALVRGAPQGHDIWLAMNARFQDSLDALRLAFSDLVPPSRVRLFEPPELDDTSSSSSAWLEQAGIAIRASVMATLGADVVVALGCGGTDPHWISIPGHDGYVNVLQVSDLGALSGANAKNKSAQASRQRLLATLTDVDLLLPTTPALETELRSLTLRPGAVIAPIDDATGMQAVWQALHAMEQRRTAAAQGPDDDQPRIRPRLACITPLPPEKSGIADYSAELLPELARYYDIEVIVDQPHVADDWVTTHIPIRDLAYFEQHAASYDRVLYHFGNSQMHRHMFGMLKRHPGIVVLHDFYLANVLHYMHHSGYADGALQQALFYSHGFGAIMDGERLGESAAVWKYPCNKEVLDHATGIIVHSAYPKFLAEQWYGPGAASNWRTLPLLRGQAGSDRAAARLIAREQLGLDPQAFMVCSFGMLGPTKLNDKLLDAWLASSLVGDKQAQLVFVGELSGGNYGRDLPSKINFSKGKKRISITGFVTPQLYQTYLAACDVAVQLRANTRGETSAAVLDCLMHGLPTIVNAHGSIAELPRSALVMLEDAFDIGSLTHELERLRHDEPARALLSTQASQYIREGHGPELVGTLYHEAVEQFFNRSPVQQYRKLVHTLQTLPTTLPPAQDDLLRAARAIAASQIAQTPRQLLIDVSAMVQTDLKTGIQRVVRSILSALFTAPPTGYRVEAVYSPGNGEPYRYARAYMQHALVTPIHDLDDTPIELNAGDIFLGLDLMMHGVHQNRPLLESYRNRGAHVYFVVYDLLPVLRPHAFPFGAEDNFADWLDTIGSVSDGLLCISRAVADELKGWYASHPPTRLRPLNLGYFHLGADIDASNPSMGMPEGAELILEQLAQRPTLLMVGTIEPRKGYAQTLAAFESLWAEDIDVNLVVIGKQGWMVEDVAKRMRDHAENGRRLFWLQGVSDEMLLKLYQAADGLLAASEGEGFGLPLIESAQHGLPIVARNLPVFREVGGDHVYYFEGTEASALADALRGWLRLLAENAHPSSSGMGWLNWRESTDQLLANLIDQKWYCNLPPTQ